MDRVKVTAARIIEQRSHIFPGALKVTEHFFEVPRDWRAPSSGTIRVFARSAQKHKIPVVPTKPKPEEKQYLCYFQGGPGFECGPPQNDSWGKFFLEKGYNVISLDQRGTGLSTPISSSTLSALGDKAAQAKYLKCFRADSIVCDAEAIRMALAAEDASEKAASGSEPSTGTSAVANERGRPWSVAGQSFGGWCITTYLSLFPESLTECFTFGGNPPVLRNNPDAVYRGLRERVVDRNRIYYNKYPEDVKAVKQILRALSGPDGRKIATLPDGGFLSPRRFLAMGVKIGFHSGIDAIHDVVLRVSRELEATGQLSWGTLDGAARMTPYDSNPIYAVLHEPIYCQGEAPKWSAERILHELPEFDFEKSLTDDTRPVYFYGEMVFPFMFEDYAHLRKLAGAAEVLAEDKDWPVLYDLEQLKRNEVPVYSAVYMEDMYVDFNLAKEALATIRGSKSMVTNLIHHDGARSSKSNDVFEGLWNLRCDVID